jgi:hypothetical protein
MTRFEFIQRALVSVALAATATAAHAQFTFTRISVPGAANSFAYGISNNDEIVGSYFTNSGKSYGFYWSAWLGYGHRGARCQFERRTRRLGPNRHGGFPQGRRYD